MHFCDPFNPRWHNMRARAFLPLLPCYLFCLKSTRTFRTVRNHLQVVLNLSAHFFTQYSWPKAKHVLVSLCVYDWSSYVRQQRGYELDTIQHNSALWACQTGMCMMRRINHAWSCSESEMKFAFIVLFVSFPPLDFHYFSPSTSLFLSYIFPFTVSPFYPFICPPPSRKNVTYGEL